MIITARVGKYGQINDVPGFIKDNRKIYNMWITMFVRCYDSKYLSKHPTYVGCLVDNKWFKLSKFLEDLPFLPGFNLITSNGDYCLDKDIRVPGNKVYSFNTCSIVSIAENTRDSNTRTDYKAIAKHPNHIKMANSQGKPVICYYPDGSNEEFNNCKDASLNNKLGIKFCQSKVAAVCRGERNHHHGCKFKYK